VLHSIVPLTMAPSRTDGLHELAGINDCIRDAAQQAAAPAGLSAMLIEGFLRDGEETWEGAGFTLAQLKRDGSIYSGDKGSPPEPIGHSWKAASSRSAVEFPSAAETIRSRIEPMVQWAGAG
jgi:hypothetical protein